MVQEVLILSHHSRYKVTCECNEEDINDDDDDDDSEGSAALFAGCRSLPPMSRANMAHTRQSRPDSGLGFQVKDLKPFSIVPSSLERGCL